MASERKDTIPWEVLNDNEILRGKQPVLNKWRNDFADLLNHESQVQNEEQGTSSSEGSNPPLIDTGLENEITLQEVKKAMSKAKHGKAVGCDDIPTEVLDNDSAVQFLFSLFHTCFESGIIPSLWLKGIIHPIPKDNTLDPRNPLNYRGITLACSTYKLYCSILNTRLVTWSEMNNLICDEQNGFRPERSCLDHLSTLTNIINTRKCMKKSTFALFVDFSKAFDRIDRQFLWDKLDKIGVPGKMLSALRCLYSNVQCCVNVNGVRTDYFNVTSGLKQGCLLSPLLFNLFTNDLVQELKKSGCGVDAGTDEKLCVLCYADDIVCIGEQEEDVQTMLNIIHKWCQTWSMSVNTKKTQIVHFRTASTPRTNYSFTLNASPISVVDRYKYLGLVVNEFLDYDLTAAMVAKAAGRALGLLIAKCKAYGGIPFDCYTRLYNALVQPIIDYGAAIWGTKEYSCINAIQHRAARFYMGVGKYTPNTAVIGDMGWEVASQKQWICVTRLWCRLINMDSSRVNKCVFKWAWSKASPGVKNWCHKVCMFFRKHSLNYLMDTNITVNVTSVLNDLNVVLSELNQMEWYEKLNRTEALRGQGLNKLRTYRQFKDSVKTEDYLKLVLNYRHRSSLAKFRCGVAPIRLETGRYEQLNVPQRICPICTTSEVETEEHVIIRCPAYTVIRNDLFESAIAINVDFNGFNDTEKLCFILSNSELCRMSAKTCYNILCLRRSILYNK